MNPTRHRNMMRPLAPDFKVVAALVLLLTLSCPVGAQQAIWICNPALPSSWFTPANWSGGTVPQAGYYVDVTNGGTAIISGATASARQLTIEGNSTVQQNGSTLTLNGISGFPSLELYSGQYRLLAGSLSVSYSIGVAEYGTADFYQEAGNVLASGQQIWLGWNTSSSGSWNLAGTGSITCNMLTLGYYGKGYFTQSAGTVTAGEVRLGVQGTSVGSPPTTVYPHGEYIITGGTLNAGVLTVGRHGSALFHQDGGTVAATTRLEIGSGAYGADVGPRRYELVNGIVNSGAVLVGAAVRGEFLQTGGTHNAGYLRIYANGNYGYTGGLLNVRGGLRLEGDLDFGGQARTLNLTNSVVDFGQGRILNASQATVTADTHTLIILPAGFDPQATFASFSPNALLQTADTVIVIPVGRSINGWGQIDEHVQCAGSLTAPSNGYLNLTSGLAVSNNAAVELRTGKLTVENTSSGMTSGTLKAGALTIGDKTTGSFTQSGGSLTVAEDVYLGYDSAGEGTFNQTLGSCAMKKRVFLGYYGDAHVTQSGGSNVISGDLYFGYLNYGQGDYTLSGNGTLSAPNEYLGWQGYGQGTFHQTGGTHTVTGKLVLGNNHPDTLGEYTLENGSLVTGYTSVGEKGLGHFTQSGGTHTITNALSVGPYGSPNFTNRGGAYTMSGGTLTVGTLQIGGSSSDSGLGGTFEILGPASIRVSKTLYLGKRATLNAIPGSEIRLTSGAAFDLLSTDPVALAGLANLRLTIDSGTGLLSQFEAASQDMGATMDGFDANFAFNALQVGAGRTSAMKLVDARDNHPSWSGSEAVYVHSLILESGSSLNLNGLNLYCVNYTNNGGTMTLNGGQFEVIPEPASLGLTALGLTALVARRRRAR